MDDNTPLHGTTSQGQDPNFTAELCQFLTSLAKTSSEEDYSNLSLNMTRLREALLTEVVDTGADSTSSPRRSADTDAPSAEGLYVVFHLDHISKVLIRRSRQLGHVCVHDLVLSLPVKLQVAGGLRQLPVQLQLGAAVPLRLHLIALDQLPRQRPGELQQDLHHQGFVSPLLRRYEALEIGNYFCF